MSIFKEVADIKTADQLHLPTPEVEYHTIASKPTEIQQEMESRVRGNSHARFGVGENPEMISKDYLSL